MLSKYCHSWITKSCKYMNTLRKTCPYSNVLALDCFTCLECVTPLFGGKSGLNTPHCMSKKSSVVWGLNDETHCYNIEWNTLL